jgi:hypothetical protein
LILTTNLAFLFKKKQERTAYIHPKEFPTAVNLLPNFITQGFSFFYAKRALSLLFLQLKTRNLFFSALAWKHVSTNRSCRNAFLAYAVTG